MTTEHNSDGLIGASIRRVEDPLLISGKGCYVDDIQLPGMLHMMVLRSAYPHAKILSMNTDAARSMKGVVAVVTGPEGERVQWDLTRGSYDQLLARRAAQEPA